MQHNDWRRIICLWIWTFSVLHKTTTTTNQAKFDLGCPLWVSDTDSWCAFEVIGKYYREIQNQSETNTCEIYSVLGKGSPSLKNVGSIWALPKWGGGLDPCPNGLGHLFWEELSMFKGAFAWFGGSEPLPGWFGALMQWKLKFKWHLLKSVRK